MLRGRGVAHRPRDVAPRDAAPRDALPERAVAGRRSGESARDVIDDDAEHVLAKSDLLLPAACQRMLGDDAADAQLCAALPSDTLVALRRLREQFPRGAGCDGLPRFLLTTQLYSLLRDRAAVDRELAALTRAGAVRRFKLATGRDDYAFLLSDDYGALVAAARADAAARGVPPATLAAAFDAFAHRVLPACPDAAALATSALKNLLRGPGAQPLPERAVDDALAALMNAGLLARAMTPGADALLFAAPGTVRAPSAAVLCVGKSAVAR